jgi:hypothetical protein
MNIVNIHIQFNHLSKLLLMTYRIVENLEETERGFEEFVVAVQHKYRTRIYLFFPFLLEDSFLKITKNGLGRQNILCSPHCIK